jgi:hypothetical protein
MEARLPQTRACSLFPVICRSLLPGADCLAKVGVIRGPFQKWMEVIRHDAVRKNVEAVCCEERRNLRRHMPRREQAVDREAGLTTCSHG